MPHRRSKSPRLEPIAIAVLLLPLLWGCSVAEHEGETSESTHETTWQYAEGANKKTGVAFYFAKIKSENTVAQDFPFEKTPAHLLIGKDEEETYLLFYIDNGQLLPRLDEETAPSGAKVKRQIIPLIVRFDGAPPVEYLFLPPEEDDATTAILPHADDLVAQLKQASTVSVEAPLFPTAHAPIFTFSTEGLEWKH